MSKASASERTKRINQAISLLKKLSPNAQVTLELQKRFGLSRRQAYRYVQEAAKAEEMLPIPEQKIVFTVRLPISLVRSLRKFARASGQSISDITARALERVLSGGEEHG